MVNCDKKIKEDICIPYALYQSIQGNYFIGQTPLLNGQDKHALAALVNPCHSKVNIYVNAMTVTNSSTLNVSTEVYLNASFKQGLISKSVSCANGSICPQPAPKAQIQYLTSTSTPPTGGTSIFSRIVSPYSTLIIDGGQIIIPPGESLILYLGGFLPIAPNSTIVAFGWWEEKICNSNDCCY